MPTKKQIAEKPVEQNQQSKKKVNKSLSKQDGKQQPSINVFPVKQPRYSAIIERHNALEYIRRTYEQFEINMDESD